MMNKDSRDIILLGVFFIAYGILNAWASGWRLPTIITAKRSTPIDMKRLTFMREQRDHLIEQENDG